MYRAKVVGVAGMERQLAVKRFHPQVLATPGVSGRLSQAARTYGGLDHPRLARLAELGVAGGETFTAVEWVNGLDLARLLAMAMETNAGLPAGASLVLISAAARAIGYAHGRGVSHLGLSPTNVIATADGDVKVTDVGILACRLPPRPSADPSLAARIAYLAPEQLIGEPVSAATDVFVLGVMAYELISGHRPFAGFSPLDIEQSVLSGRPSPLELPRPVSRVIDRCLARSPFERFPDARALADALDAALRLSPLAGSKRDVADRVAAALEHIARLNEQQLSGALSFALPTAPQPQRQSTAQSLPLPPPTSRTGAAPAIPRPRPASVVPPAPQGHTLRGSPPAAPRAPTELTGDTTINRDDPDDANLAIGDQTLPRIQPLWPPTEQVPTLKPPPPPTGLNRTLMMPPPPPPPQARPMGSNPPPFETRSQPPRYPEGSPPPHGPPSFGPPSQGAPPPHGPPPHGPPPHGPPPHGPPSFGPPSQGAPPPHGSPLHGPPPHGPPSHGPPMAMSPMGGPHAPPPMQVAPPPRRSRPLIIAALIILLVGIAGVGAFFIHRQLESDEAAGIAAAAPDAALVAASTLDAAAELPPPSSDAGRAALPPPADAAAELAVITDAAAALDVPVDAGAAAATIDAGATAPPPDSDGKLVIRSEPAGALVFLDGAEQGKTPVTVAGSADRHSVAIALAGYDLHLAEIDGSGTHVAKLTAVSPPEGPAGIKVRCKNEERYYVFLDGKPTGQFCPTERLGVEKGDHAVEVYDLVSETRRQFTAKVRETRVSVRVRVE